MTGDRNATIDEMIEETDSDIARAIFVLAREIGRSRVMLSEFLGHDAGGRLDLYCVKMEEAISNAAEQMNSAASIDEMGTEICVAGDKIARAIDRLPMPGD